jgi:hypothetical protein
LLYVENNEDEAESTLLVRRAVLPMLIYVILAQLLSMFYLPICATHLQMCYLYLFYRMFVSIYTHVANFAVHMVGPLA